MGYQIFISYRRDGAEALGQLIYQQLTEKGYRVFYDVESLRSGRFNEELFKVIDECRDILVILPPGGLDRCRDENDWVRKEIAYALEKKKNLVPVMMRGFKFPETLPEDMEELRNYNGIEANMTLFPAVMEKLAEQFLTSVPSRTKKRTQDEEISLWKKIPRFFLGVFILLIPVILKFTYQETWLLPPSIHSLCRTYVTMDLELMYLGVFLLVFVVYEFTKNGDLELLRKKYQENTLELLDFNGSPENFQRNILRITEGKAVPNNGKGTEEESENCVFVRHLKGIDMASGDGGQIDYFFRNEKADYDRLRVFYIGGFTIKHHAARLLSAQEFDYCEIKNRILHFKKDDLHVRIAYNNFGWSQIGLEVCRGDYPSSIEERLRNEMDGSMDLWLEEIKAGGRKLFHRLEEAFLNMGKKAEDPSDKDE